MVASIRCIARRKSWGKSLFSLALFLVLTLSGTATSSLQGGFESGSTGEDGAFNLSTDGLTGTLRHVILNSMTGR